MSKAFASQADLTDKKTTFEQLSQHCWAYTTEGDPNSGVIIGERFIMVSDATATPAMARDLIAKIRTVSDLPIKYVLLTHYHAVRVLGAYAYAAEGATEIIASQGTLELIRERGAQDMKSEMERFPRLFRNAETVPGLTWPTMVIGGGNPAQRRSAGQAQHQPGRRGGADLEPRSRPHARRHHRLGGRRESAVLGRPGRVRGRRLHRRRATGRMARHAGGAARSQGRVPSCPAAARP